MSHLIPNQAALPNRSVHAHFFDEELRQQVLNYEQKANTTARQLLEDRHEVFVAKFIKVDEATGHLILAFNPARHLPRRRSHFDALIPAPEQARFKQWPANLTWRDLFLCRLALTPLSWIWQQQGRTAEGWVLAGFAGAEVEFTQHLRPGSAVLLGPQMPPVEYLANLQQVVKNTAATVAASYLLDLPTAAGAPFVPAVPEQLSTARHFDLASFLLGQLRLQPIVLVQGPPGTGKTYLMAQLCARLLASGARVLVTALTNQALTELAAKEALDPWRQQGRVLKTALATDEVRRAPGLQSIGQVQALAGTLVLATFHKTSQLARPDAPQPRAWFDYVIVDEASQAFLATFALVRDLGERHLWIGDQAQLPPVVVQPTAKLPLPGIVPGLLTISRHTTLPAFRLIQTYRLTARAAAYTGLFYEGQLQSTAPPRVLLPPSWPTHLLKLLHPQGGPTLVCLPLPVGHRAPDLLLHAARQIVEELFADGVPLEVAVLAYHRETVGALLKTISAVTLPNRCELIIDTVHRVQGLTVDVCLFLLPNAGTDLSLAPPVFNVATSRATRHTILVAAEALADSPIGGAVGEFLRRLAVDSPSDTSHVAQPVDPLRLQ